MMRLHRLISASVLLSLSMALAGCGGGGLGNFDPTDLLDFLDTKKKLPGDRKQVFPEGVPGLQPGVPKELYKGAQAEPEPQAAPPIEDSKGKRGSKSASRSKGRAAPAAAPPEIAPDDANVEVGTPTAVAPPAKRVVRRRTTAPPPDAPAGSAPAQQPQPAQSAFPAPLPSGGFSR